MGIPVESPDVNFSFKGFSVIKAGSIGAEQPITDEIRFGLHTIKNVGEHVVEGIISERANNGSFKDIEDLVTRVQSKDLNKKSLESLIKGGALDAFGERNQLLFNAETLLAYAKEKQRNILGGQTSLFGEDSQTTLPPLKLAAAPAEATAAEKLVWEKELLGLYVSDHPLSAHKESFALNKIIPIKIASANIGTSVRIGGIITRVQRITTKNGKPMIFSAVEDLSSKIEVVVFPSILEKYPDAWQENGIVMIQGRIDNKDGSPKIICESVKSVVATA
jgi:DNA polymerase-3 subunit alpha